jgi:ethanolamine ammonia-lyase large subunit
MYGCGDACIGINPASESAKRTLLLLERIDELRSRFEIPVQSCVLAHVTTLLQVMNRGGPADLVFQSIAGSEAANRAFGVSLALLDEAHQGVKSLGRAPAGANLMYFETGQGAALSAHAHHGADQQTMEARAYAVARRYAPLLVNTVVGRHTSASGAAVQNASRSTKFCFCPSSGRTSDTRCLGRRDRGKAGGVSCRRPHRRAPRPFRLRQRGRLYHL